MAEEARAIVAREEIGVRIGAITGISPVLVHS
jgi:hypothetical protein